MIVYIASYPRSGNFWIQSLFGNQFKLPTTRMYSKFGREETLRRWISQNQKYYDIKVFDLSQDSSFKQDDPLREWMTGYTLSGSDEIRKALLPGCVNLVEEPQIRKMLANDKEHYLLKTHFLPFEDYFEGEYVIQVVRNAGASLWSYYRYKRDIQGYTGNLTAVIKGETGYGGWTEYHAQWLNALEKAHISFLQVRYEDLFNREFEFCEKVQSFLNLPILSKKIKPFDFYQRLRPVLTRKGKATGWEENFSEEQLHLLWDLHGTMMQHFGYLEPDYNLGLDKVLY